MALVLYNYDLDENCYKVRLAIEQETPPFLAMNPMGTLPILKDGELTLSGAEAILAHLAWSHGGAGRWLPADGAGFARAMQWLVFAAGELSVATRARAHALFGMPGDEAALRAGARRAIDAMEDAMTVNGFAGQDWFAGTAPTVADVALFPAFALSRDFGIDHDAYPALRKWARRFRAIPGFLTMPGIPDYH
jgi:glutathione S-transferase